jgi:hypothetical protein
MVMSPFLSGALAWIADGGRPDRCDACGFRWADGPDEGLAVIAGAPVRYSALLAGRDGMAPADDGGWNATGYVWHLADLAGSWSERWVQLSVDPGGLLAGWDPDELAAARNYRGLPTVAALWALDRNVATFVELTRMCGYDVEFEHGDWGTGTTGDGVRWLAHEFRHHELDVDARARSAP